MKLAFNHVECTPDLLPNDVTGVSAYRQDSGGIAFRPGPVFVSVVLTDEVNRGRTI